MLKAHKGTQDIYKVHLAKKRKEETYKKYSLPHPDPNQSKKSTIFVYPLLIYTTHIKRLLRKIFFSL